MLALLVIQFFYSREELVAGQVYLLTDPDGATISVPNASSIAGAHLKKIATSPEPLPINLAERPRFTFVVDLWGFKQETLRVSGEKLAKEPLRVELKPLAWYVIPVYFLRDNFPGLLALVVAATFFLLRVRPQMAARRLQAELWEAGEIRPGMEIYDYRVVRFLGEGASGSVYLVEKAGGDRHYALKVLNSGGYSGEKRQSLVERECRSIKELNHPGIVALYDWGELNGLLYIVMEYLGGVTLGEVENPSAEEVCRWAGQVVGALSYAHQKGLVHRDLKPDNLILDDKSRAKLLDFGIAAFTSDEGGEIAGTIGYMAPEQVSGKISPACDYYSLGVTMYRLLSGTMPYRGEDDFQVLGAQSLGKYEPLSALRPDLPSDLSDLVDELLRPDPEARLTDPDTIISRLSR